MSYKVKSLQSNNGELCVVVNGLSKRESRYYHEALHGSRLKAFDMTISKEEKSTLLAYALISMLVGAVAIALSTEKSVTVGLGIIGVMCIIDIGYILIKLVNFRAERGQMHQSVLDLNNAEHIKSIKVQGDSLRVDTEFGEMYLGYEIIPYLLDRVITISVDDMTVHLNRNTYKALG
jgi:hypothetical protein